VHGALCVQGLWRESEWQRGIYRTRALHQFGYSRAQHLPSGWRIQTVLEVVLKMFFSSNELLAGQTEGHQDRNQ
jgi:hypothetical protein